MFNQSISYNYFVLLKEAAEIVGVKLYNTEWEKLENLLDYE